MRPIATRPLSRSCPTGWRRQPKKPEAWPGGMLRERGRGAVLVGVARVDAALESLLCSALAPPRGSETLFHTDLPLGSFGALARRASACGRSPWRLG